MTSTTRILRTITAEADLFDWLLDQASKTDPAILQDLADCNAVDGGCSIIKILTRWEGADPYVQVALRDGEVRFTGRPACVTHLGVEIAVRLPDRHRFDLVALASGYL